MSGFKLLRDSSLENVAIQENFDTSTTTGRAVSAQTLILFAQ